MFKKVLLQTDLTPSQAEILDFLYQNKEAKASVIAKNINRSRAIVYKEAEELSKMGVLEKIDRPNQVTVYSANHPSNLQKLMEQKEDQIKKDKELLANYLPDIISSFNLINNKPGIRYYEGIEGLSRIYDEILDEGKDFLLLRSAYDPVYKKEIVPIIENFIKKRVAKNIKVKAITPADTAEANAENDARWLMERFWVDKEVYNSPVEIDIFGNKVAILSFGEELIGLIIESRQIAKSLEQLFNLAVLSSKISKPEPESVPGRTS